MSGITRSNFLCPSAESYAKSAVATIGIQNNTFGCFSHALQVRGVSRWSKANDDKIIFFKFYLASIIIPERVFDNIVNKDSDKKREQFFQRREAEKKGN